VHDAEPGCHGRQAHAEVGDDEEQRKHAGSLVRGGPRHHQADAALETAAEADPADRGADEEDSRGLDGQREQRDRHTSDQRDDPGDHHHAGRGVAQQEHRDDGGRGEHRQAQPAEHLAGGTGEHLDQRRAERGVQPGQRPDREQHRRGGQHLDPHGSRQFNLRHQRAERPGATGHRLPHNRDTGGLQREHAKQR
jgi:hypothetical protein